MPQDTTTTPQDAARPDEEILLDLNFIPRWARKEPAANHYQIAEEKRPERPVRNRRERGERRDGSRSPRGERPPRVRRETAGAAGRAGTARPARVELPVQVKFLPEQERLASMVRQIHHSKRAYPLMDLANLFLSDAKGHLVKIEIQPGAEGFKLYQGKRSKMVATDRDVLLRQILDDHIEDFFVKEELETEPPSGVFPCIGKIDDILIGPPNHHSYADRLTEVHRTRYAGMSFDRFKQKVQTVRDEELVEQWKREASKKTIYRLRDASEDEAREFSLAQAEEYVRSHIAETEIEEVSRAVLPSGLARKIRDFNLIRMVREAWQAETRFPLSLSFALRAAFRHMHLCMFKAGKNINFVTAVKPDPIAPEAAVENIRAVLEYLADHRGSTREQLVEGLRPGAAEGSDEAHEVLKPLRWLIEKGHIIEFFNGTLSVPSRRRRR